VERTDLKNMAVCQEQKAYIWKIKFHTISFEAITLVPEVLCEAKETRGLSFLSPRK
jgi:hypothetical protein